MDHDQDLQPLNKDEINNRLADLPGWEYEDNRIEKSFEFPSFNDGLGLLNSLAPSLNQIDHHPVILIKYKKISFCLTSHDLGDRLSGRDFRVAEIIEDLYGK